MTKCEYCFDRTASLEYKVKSRWLRVCDQCYGKVSASQKRHPVEKG